jgi:hypothetical protein
MGYDPDRIPKKLGRCSVSSSTGVLPAMESHEISRRKATNRITLKKPNLRDPELAVPEEPERTPLPNDRHYSELDPKFVDEPVFTLLATGQLPSPSEWTRLRIQLKKLIQLCAERLWVTETAECYRWSSIVSQKQNLHFPSAKKTSVKASQHEELDRICKERQQMINEKERVEEVLEEERNCGLKALEDEFTKALQELDSRYSDGKFLAKFGRPSREFLESRAVAQRLMSSNRMDDAQKVLLRMDSIKLRDEAKQNQIVADRYHLEDQQIKERFAVRRKLFLQKCERKKGDMESRFNATLAVMDKKVAQCRDKVRLYSRRQSQGLEGKEMRNCASQRGNRMRCDAGLFSCPSVAPPKLISREKDLEVLKWMAEDLGRGLESARRNG